MVHLCKKYPVSGQIKHDRDIHRGAGKHKIVKPGELVQPGFRITLFHERDEQFE